MCISAANPSSVNAGFKFDYDERDNEIRGNAVIDASDYIVDIREYDVPYHVRVAIDRGKPCPFPNECLSDSNRH